MIRGVFWFHLADIFVNILKNKGLAFPPSYQMEQLFWTMMWKLHAEMAEQQNWWTLGSLALWSHYWP